MTAPTLTPRTLYIHDDLSDLLQDHGHAAATRRLGQALLALVRRRPDRIVVLTLAEQVEGVIAQGPHPPFAVAIGIGRAGARVAAEIHRRAGWFPRIERADIWREEDDQGEYVLAGPAPLAVQLGGLAAGSLAIVDDTVFSGLTMRTVLSALPPGARGRTHAFCLRGVAQSIAGVSRLAPLTAGFAAPGRLLEDVSFINASGLVTRGAIRRVDRPSLAFFERPEWMAAWFPGFHHEVIELCRELNARLESRLRAGPAE